MGNPTSYRGHSLEWGRIRLLTKWDDTVMEYNASGIRTRKGDTYYELDGDSVISETTNGSTIRYYYGNGGIVGFRYNGSRYYYEKNLMGDIVGIYDESGNKVGAYTYDAWGNCTVTENINDVASANPFRYRGYYYDSDLGLYYLKSRYYDSQVGRFINADSINYLGANRDLGAYNLFAYCSCNPSTLIDTNGNKGVAFTMLWDAFFGNGKHQDYSNNREMIMTFAQSDILNAEIDARCSEFKKTGLSQMVYSGSVAFYGNDWNTNDLDLHLGVGKASYTMVFAKETQKKKFLWLFTYTVTTYTVEVTITDIYNFDEYRDENSISNWLNNWGYDKQFEGDIVPYDWSITFSIVRKSYE